MQSEARKIRIFTDGGSRGNPGPAALGVYIENERGEVLFELGKALGVTTNNVAEYSAVSAAFDWLLANSDAVSKVDKVEFYMDSQLVVYQLGGLYKIKNEALKQIFYAIREKEQRLSARSNKSVSYTHVPRERNTQADRMVNKALDEL